MIRPLAHACLVVALAVSAGCAGVPMLVPTLAHPRGDFRPGEVVVAWAETATETDRQAVTSRLGLTELPSHGTRHDRMAVPVGQELTMCRQLRGERAVATAEPNYVVRTRHVPGSLKRAGADRQVLHTPNDTAYGLRRDTPAQDVLWGVKAIKADQAWDVTKGDTRIKVAVIDTGVDMNHPDLAANLDTRGALNLLETGRAMIDDFGHGTHVAGIVAAIGDNGTGGVGVAYKTRVIPIRVLGVDGSGSVLDLIDAIDHAVAQGAKVINLSLGSPDRSDLEGQAIERAIAAGVVVVAAAGNEATTGNYMEYPASYPGVLSVGAVGPDLKRAPFSNFNSQVSLSAPGVDIFSTLPTAFGKDNPYGYLSGTSMAAPMVAGAAALVLAAHPTWTPAQVTSRLRTSARDLALNEDTPSYSPFFGDGLLDAAQAVQ